MDNKNELKMLLEKVSDTYDDFVYGVILSVREHNDRAEKLIKFMKKYPEASSSEVTDFLDKLEGILEWNPETNQFEVPEIPEI